MCLLFFWWINVYNLSLAKHWVSLWYRFTPLCFDLFTHPCCACFLQEKKVSVLLDIWYAKSMVPNNSHSVMKVSEYGHELGKKQNTKTNKEQTNKQKKTLCLEWGNLGGATDTQIVGCIAGHQREMYFLRVSNSQVFDSKHQKESQNKLDGARWREEWR